MAITDFASLKTEINNWLVRNEADSDLETFIQLTESTMRRRLRTIEMEITACATLTGEAIALPTDFRSLRSIFIDAAPRKLIQYVGPERMRELSPDTGSGVPDFYTIADGQFKFAPSTSEETTLQIIYFGTIPALSDSNPTNWVIDDHPDAYLFGSLLEAQPFVGADERAPVWFQKFEQAIQEIKDESARKRMGGARLQMKQQSEELLGIG